MILSGKKSLAIATAALTIALTTAGCDPFEANQVGKVVKPVVEPPLPPPERSTLEFKVGTYVDVAAPYACSPASVAASDNFMRRLTRQEILKSIEVIFGEAVLNAPIVASAARAVPIESDGKQRVEYFDNRITNQSPLLDLALSVSTEAIANATILNRVLPGCNNGAAMTVCTSQLVDRLAKSIFRRPLSTIEKNQIRDMIAALGNNREALGAAIARLLASPYFHQLYIGTNTQEESGRLRLTAYEVASRVSFTLLGAPPDEILMTAADRDELKTVEQVRAQAKRLVETPQAKAQFMFFLRNWLAVDASDPSPKTAEYRGIASSGLGQEIDDELKAFVDYVVFQKNGSFKDLYLDRTIFPRSSRLASLFGSQVSSEPIQSSENRGGLLLRPSLHKQLSEITSTISRGVRFRKKVLCSNLPSPDVSIVGERAVLSSQFSHMNSSNREIVSEVTKDRKCQGCHDLINPLGFVFENFGALGELRSMEPVFDENGNFVKEHQIDVVVSNIAVAGRTPKTISSPYQLVEEIQASDASKRCFSQQLFRETRIKDASSVDGCVMGGISDVLERGGSVKDALISNVANEDIFWRVAK